MKRQRIKFSEINKDVDNFFDNLDSYGINFEPKLNQSFIFLYWYFFNRNKLQHFMNLLLKGMSINCAVKSAKRLVY